HEVVAVFALDTRTVTASVAGGNGSIAPVTGTVDYGSNASLTVTPAANYHLATLTDNGADVTAKVSGGLYTVTGVTADHNVVATFAIDTKTVTASVNGGNGSITPLAGTVNYGGSATLTVAPAAGYHLESLTDNGADVTAGVANGTYTIAGVRENHTVVATFRWITFSVTPTASANGLISPATKQTVDAGRSVNFTVTPNAGYQVAGVTGCGGSLSGNIFSTAPIFGDCSVSATFVATPVLKGDLNGDGKLDLTDALLALQLAVGEKPRTAALVATGDVAPIVNGKSEPDKVLDIGDAVALLLRSVGQLTW
ncbi:MAG TPA: hypothetical protein DCZ75_09285, partial [Geobacter sp.]|nr:hypothetical protein [Geobacter sp.]